MGGGTGNKGGYKVGHNEDGEGMCASVASLEPDPRYTGCCANIFRRGRVVRDLIVGSLVVLVIAVVIAVVFAVCFFLIPDQSGATTTNKPGEEGAFHGVPSKQDGSHHGINEVEFNNSTRYEVDPQLEKTSKGSNETKKVKGHDHEDHKEHHHVGPVPEAEPEPEPEPTSEPEPEPKAEDRTHPAMNHENHTHPDMDNHTLAESDHDHTHPEMDRNHTHPEMDHNHTHPESDHDHTHPLTHHEPGPVTLDHTHPEMDHDHTHPEMDHDHTHPEMGHNHTHEQGPVAHDDTHPADSTTKAMEMLNIPGTSESEMTSIPTTDTTTDREEDGLPPLFKLFSTGAPIQERVDEDSEGTLKELVVPQGHFTEETHHATEAHPDVTLDTTVAARTHETPLGECRPRQLEMCSDLPHVLTAFPNWAGDQTEEDLQQTSLPFLRDVIVRSRCSPRAKEYSCAILEPPCTADGTILPPCRTFCKSVASTCQEFITSRFSLSSAFNCEKFPDSSDPNVCFDMTNAEGVSEQTGFGPFHHLPPAPQDGFRNEDSPSDPPTSYTEAQPDTEHLENKATQDNHPAFELTPTEDYDTGYHEEGVDSLAVNTSYPLDDPDEFTQPESSTPPPRTATDAVLNNPSHPGGFVLPPAAETTTCGQDEFECVDGSACLPSEAVCDGVEQCRDRSDEGDCQHVGSVSADNTTALTPTTEEAEGTETTLPETTTLLLETETFNTTQCPELQCLDGTCISLSQVNDGVVDCPEGIDEEDFGGLL